MATTQQLASYRDALRYDNEAARYQADSMFQDWQKKLSDIQTNMQANQKTLRSASRRAAQVSAAGGSGDYNVNKYATTIADLKKQVQTSKSGVSVAPKINSDEYGVRPLSVLQPEILSYQNTIEALNKEIAGMQNTLTNPGKDQAGRPITIDATSYKNQIIQKQGQLTDFQNKLKEDQDQFGEQQVFEDREKRYADTYNNDIMSKEQTFINSILDSPVPDEPSLRGVNTLTDAQKNEQRDQAINSSINPEKMVGKAGVTNKPAETTYLAKQKTSLPLAGFNVANLKQASNRVQGSTLGGNSNKLVA